MTEDKSRFLAERVMGWEYYEMKLSVAKNKVPSYVDNNGYWQMWVGDFNPLENEPQAWACVDAFLGKDLLNQFAIVKQYHWECSVVTRNSGGNVFVQLGPTRAAAICNALLQALGYEESE